MAEHLTREQKAQYKAEMEYQHENSEEGHKEFSAALKKIWAKSEAQKQLREDNARQRRFEDDERYKREHPSAYERIKGAVTGAATTAYDAGAQARQTGMDIGNTPAVRSMRSQDGFTQSSRQRYQNVPAAVDPNSAMHPGNRLYVIQGTMISSKSTEPRQPRNQQPRRRQWQTGGLGGDDPGF